jgi:RNA polymerase sigma-70 factor (ECF subfamily)
MDDRKSMLDVLGQLAAMTRYARLLSRNAADAEDLVHDALIRAYERRTTFRRGANLRSWLMSILHNTHVDKRRSATARARREADTMAEADVSYPPHQEHQVRAAQIRKAFDRLPEDQRTALHLIAVEELSYQEASDALGVPVGTLMSRVSRARTALRDFEAQAGRPSHLRLVGGDND